MSREKPVILLVDDEPDQLRAFADEITRRGHAEAATIPPEALEEGMLEKADLVCMDLSLEHWSAPPAFTKLKAQPLRGLGLTGALEEHVQQEYPKRAIAFALYSGKVDLIAKNLRGGDHVIARVHNVEWVFRKRQDELEIARLVTLAKAVAMLPAEWPAEGGKIRKAAADWLALGDDQTWSERAWLDVEDCHPPVHGISAHTRGTAFLRWMLQRILPYPTALIDLYHLAARLRVKPASLSKSLSEPGALRELLAPALYGGQLSEFGGPHWWRAGVNAQLFDLGAASPGDLELLRTKLIAMAGDLETVDAEQPVVVLGPDLVPQAALSSIEDAVRVQPDDWPPFASPAWMRIDVVAGDEDLRGLVIEDDRDRVPAEGLK